MASEVRDFGISYHSVAFGPIPNESIGLCMQALYVHTYIQDELDSTSGSIDIFCVQSQPLISKD